MRPGWIVGFLCVAAAVPHGATAQQRVTLGEAVAAALAHGPRVRLATVDEAAARAAVLTARAWPNPTANLVYSKAVPSYHATIDQPLEFPWLRAARIRAARAGALGAAYRLEIERAAVRFSVDSAYVQAAAAAGLAALSARTAQEGAELVRVARIRRDAGDASDLDVDLAVVAQGGLVNAALTDSLDAVAALLRLQALMGLPSVAPQIVLADSLEMLAGEAPPGPAAVVVPLRIAAAELQVQSQRATLAQERAARIAAPGVMAGVEWHDPSQKGLLPTFGLSIPLPLFDRNRGPIATAQAGLLRAQTELETAQREGAAALAAAERDLHAARLRTERGRSLLEQARRVVALTIRGYREGAFPITTVIEAQRTARDTLRQQILDLAALRTATAALALAQLVGSMP
jgi:cobalt-zinc-cadmium efflux system outer membrane protein